MPPHASDWKSRLRPHVPLVVRRAKRALFGWRWFRGRYPTWAAASPHAVGYDGPGILDKVLQATLEVKAGRAAYERDSVLFHEPAIEADLLACLEQVAAERGGRLRVLDFGGSLGTTYWQHRGALGRQAELRWDVVEQPHFVEAGRQHLQDGTLRFFATIEEAARDGGHDMLLASGVLHCLPDPHTWLDRWARTGPPVLLFHNLPLHDDGPDHVRIEHVPPEIYPASYPVWFFNRAGFLGHFADHYDVARSYASTAVWPIGWRDYPSTGLMLRRRAP